MANKIKSTVLAGLISVGAVAGELQERVGSMISGPHKPNVVLTRVEPDKEKTRQHVQYFQKLPLDLDLYGIAQEQADSDFYKARLQWIPLKEGPLSLGIAGQYVNGSNFPEHTELGIASRLQGKPTKDTFGKIDLRYFPDRETFDSYGFLTGKKIYADCLSSYNHETGAGFIQLGADLKLGKGLLLGLETKFSGKFSDLKKSYVGLRGKICF